MLSAYNLALSFPAPILLALILHYTPNLHLKKFAQTVTYAPHFISTVVLVGMLNIFLSPSSGFVNSLIKAWALARYTSLAKRAGSGMYMCFPIYGRAPAGVR